ncbi:MAG: hypothetical protein LC101_09840 [Flavobacteriales bacterium]|nr:hypothetical protein [Flavobacteriales bacterium]
MKGFFSFVSYLFHPLFMPLVGAMIILTQIDIYRLLIPSPLLLFIALVLVVLTIFLPVFALLGMRMAGIISSLQLPDRNERRYPLLITVILFTASWWIIKSVNLVQSVNYIFIAGLFTIMLLMILNHFIKLSIHMAALGGLTGLLTAYATLPGFDATYFLTGVLLASGLVASSRLYLHAHSVKEVIIGYTVGFLSQYILLIYLLHPIIFSSYH